MLKSTLATMPLLHAALLRCALWSYSGFAYLQKHQASDKSVAQINQTHHTAEVLIMHGLPYGGPYLVAARAWSL